MVKMPSRRLIQRCSYFFSKVCIKIVGDLIDCNANDLLSFNDGIKMFLSKINIAYENSANAN